MGHSFIFGAGCYAPAVIPCPTDLRLRIYVTALATAFGPVTIDADSAGTITVIDADGLTNLIVSVDGTPVSAPFSLAIGEVLTGAFDPAVGGEVPELTGTY